MGEDTRPFAFGNDEEDDWANGVEAARINGAWLLADGRIEGSGDDVIIMVVGDGDWRERARCMVGDKFDTNPPVPTPAAAAAAGVTGVGMAPSKLVTNTDDMVSDGARRRDCTEEEEGEPCRENEEEDG